MSATGASATRIAEAVRAGRLSASAVLEEHLEVVRALEGSLGAFVTVLEDEARRQAAEVDRKVAAGEDPGPLAGVPVAVKDNLCTRGIPTTCASKILAGWRPPYDATVVCRVRDAGAVLLGKANLDEFAMGSSTENSSNGPSKNPHDPSRVPGGSSGGSAVAVASGMSPLALGSETGGSVRQPASLCGVVGMKPTYGRVSRYGLVAFASSLDQVGPLGRDVKDTAALFDVIAGHDELDSTSLDNPSPRGAQTLEEGVDKVRVGILTELTKDVDPVVAARVRQAAQALADAGASVDEVSVPELGYGLPAYYLLASAEASSNLARYDGVRYGLRVDAPNVEQMNSATRSRGFGAEVKRRIMLGTYALSAGYYEAYYGQAQRARTLIIDAFGRAYERFDVLLGATSPFTAFRLGEKVDDPLSMYMSDVCTAPSNLAGHPALSVPFGTDEAGLPIGVQVLAPALEEGLMLRVGAAVEAAAPPVAAPRISRWSSEGVAAGASDRGRS